MFNKVCGKVMGQSRQTPSSPPDCMNKIIENKIVGSHTYVLQYNYNRNTLVYIGVVLLFKDIPILTTCV